LFHLAQLLGLLSLLGQRVPDALATFVAELREQTKISADYCNRLEARLAGLPREIADGVDAVAIAKAMSESFRQQVVSAGVREAAALLHASARDAKTLSNQISATLKPLLNEYKSISATISAELAKLMAASRHLEHHNARLITEQYPSRQLWQCLLALVLFLIGGICGILIESHRISDDLANIHAQIERIRALQTSAVSPFPKSNERSGLARRNDGSRMNLPCCARAAEVPQRSPDGADRLESPAAYEDWVRSRWKRYSRTVSQLS
jgi:hypothetical protein